MTGRNSSEEASKAGVSRRSTSVVGLGAVLASTVFWGIGSSFGKKADLDGVVLSFWRMWIATGMIALFMAAVRRWPSWLDFRRSVPMGVLFGLNICAFFITIEYISISVALIIGALTPVVALPIAVLFMGERLTGAKVVSAVVAVAGVVGAVLAAPSTSDQADTAIGYAWAVVSLFAWVTYLLASKRVRRKVETVRLLACSSLVGAVTVSVVVAVTGKDVAQMNGARWMWISLLALIPGLLGHGIFSWAQPRVDASVSSVLIQAEPVIASFAAWGILGQRVSLLQMLSMGVVVAALGALAWSESREPVSLVLPEEDPRV